MSARYFSLTPLDAWFFRDGRPYNQAESNQAGVRSLFPPPARTLTGALRAALARANGWDGTRRWPDALNSALGDGPENLGRLQFCGPFLLRNGLPLWPVPRHLLGRPQAGKWVPRAFLRPGGDTIQTDKGALRLPEIALPPGEGRAGLKLAESAWISAAGLTEALAGRLPPGEAVFGRDHLWRLESRVALERDDKTHQVREGDLYSPSYVRLCRGVALALGLADIPANIKGLPALFPLGGESRLAQAQPWDGSPLPAAPPPGSFKAGPDGLVAFALVLLTPGRFGDPAPLLGPAARTISACVGKPVPIGGWDSLNNEPLPLEPFHPAGSVWFCEAPTAQFPGVCSRHGKWLGAHTAHGFGQIVIGLWPSGQPSKEKP